MELKVSLHTCSTPACMQTSQTRADKRHSSCCPNMLANVHSPLESWDFDQKEKAED